MFGGLRRSYDLRIVLCQDDRSEIEAEARFANHEATDIKINGRRQAAS
jgi:hypothetical protein